MDTNDPKDFNITLPNTFSYTIPGLDIGHEHFLFTYISIFLSLITPYDLPLDVIRDAFHSNLTLVDFVTKSMKIESGFLVLMTIFVILSFVPLGATISWCCHRKSKTSKSRNDDPVNPLIILDDTIEKSVHCRRKASLIVLAIFFIILILTDILIFVTNSQLSSTIKMTPELIHASVDDMKVFLKDTHVQIKYKLDNGFDISIERAVKDLNDIDILLGEPIRIEVSANTGIELAFDSLNSISLANLELITRIQLLQESLNKALRISQEATARMEELQIQLSVLQRQCTFRDRPLCDTLRIRSFEENGIIDALKTLQEDQNIFRMKYLGELESGTMVRNLSNEVAISKSLFGNFPIQIKSDTVIQRNETLEQLEQIKHKTTANAHLLTHTITSLLDKLTGTWESIEPYYSTIQNLSDKYWLITWSTGMLIIWIIVFMAMTFCCFLCDSKVKAAVIMITCISLICVGSFVIMIYGIVSLSVGGNTEIFLCQPLFDSDEYVILGKILDKPGYAYEKELKNGIIGDLLRPSDENRTLVNVDLAKAIRDCEQNKPSYTVFHLDAFVNTQHTDTMKFPKVTAALNSIQVSEKTLFTLTQTIQLILENMLQTSDLNSTTYRTSISQPTPEKDLATFIDQMQRVALQIQDVATSSRMTTLGSRAKRLQASILQPLELLRNEILYHLTALELQKEPWTRQVNQTLIHLRNIQGYLEKTAGEICANQTKLYVKRLKDYLSLDKDLVSTSLGDKTAMCRPLFDIFEANRNFLCRNAVDSLNGLWFCTFIILLIWAIGTPIALNIISLHHELNNISDAKRTSTLDPADRNWRSTRQAGSSAPRTPSHQTPRQTPNRTPTTTTRNRPVLRPQRTESMSSLSLRSLEVETGGSRDDDNNNKPVRNTENRREPNNIRDQHSSLQQQTRNMNIRDNRDARDTNRDMRDSRNIRDTMRDTMRDIRDMKTIRTERNRERDRERDREYRGIPRPPPIPPAPPAPPPPDYMNRNSTENLHSERSWIMTGSPRREIRERSPRGNIRDRIYRTPPSPPAHQPPAPGYMNRQDSVRSVRWETSEDIEFEEVDSANPRMMRN